MQFYKSKPPKKDQQPNDDVLSVSINKVRQDQIVRFLISNIKYGFKVLGLGKNLGHFQPKEDDSPLSGLRFQLYKALSELSLGEKMVVTHKIPSIKMSNVEREKFFKLLSKVQEWENADRQKLEPIIVPGTLFSKPIGRTLLKYNWVRPIQKEHWVPNMRFYEITDDGRKALLRANNWWKNQSFWQKCVSCFTE